MTMTTKTETWLWGWQTIPPYTPWMHCFAGSCGGTAVIWWILKTEVVITARKRNGNLCYTLCLVGFVTVFDCRIALRKYSSSQYCSTVQLLKNWIDIHENQNCWIQTMFCKYSTSLYLVRLEGTCKAEACRRLQGTGRPFRCWSWLWGTSRKGDRDHACERVSRRRRWKSRMKEDWKSELT